MNNYSYHTHLFASSDDSEESVQAARDYITEHNFQKDDVKLVKREGQVVVIAKREVII